MIVSTLTFNSQKFVFNGEYLQRIKYNGGKKQNRRVIIPDKERPALLSVFQDENIGDCEKWMIIADQWNHSIVNIFEPFTKRASN